MTLEELYNGTKKKLSLNRKELCKTCDGRGGLVSIELHVGKRNHYVIIFMASQTITFGSCRESYGVFRVIMSHFPIT